MDENSVAVLNYFWKHVTHITRSTGDIAARCRGLDGRQVAFRPLRVVFLLMWVQHNENPNPHIFMDHLDLNTTATYVIDEKPV